jgi:mono/diheme cytochrome c family protein
MHVRTSIFPYLCQSNFPMPGSTRITLLLIGGSLIALLAATSCRHQPVLPDRQISFSSEVMPILAGNCTQSGCHGSNGGEFELLTYDDVMKDGRVVAGDAHHSKIYTSITATSGEDQMPQPPNSPLTSEQVQTIFTWIMQGAKNN